jgi:hypothetical protein
MKEAYTDDPMDGYNSLKSRTHFYKEQTRTTVTKIQ